MKFIKLTTYNENRVHTINVSYIRYYRRLDDMDFTQMDIDDGGDSFWKFKETPEEIDSMIGFDSTESA